MNVVSVENIILFFMVKYINMGIIIRQKGDVNERE